LTVWLSVVREFDELHFQVCTEPIRLINISFFTPVVKDELVVLQQGAAFNLPAELRIAFSFC